MSEKPVTYWVRVRDPRMPRDGVSSHRRIAEAAQRAAEELAAAEGVVVTISGGRSAT